MITKEEFLKKQDLTVEISIEETFDKLKGLKTMGLKDTSDKIIYNGYKLPAGAYEEFKPFMTCFKIINMYYESNKEKMIIILKKAILNSVKNIGYDEKIIAIIGWDTYYRNLREDNKRLFTDREIMDLTNEILDEKEEKKKQLFIIK